MGHLNIEQNIIVDKNLLLALLNIDDNKISAKFGAMNVFQGEDLRATTNNRTRYRISVSDLNNT